MSESSEPRTSEGFRRLISFADAVVAIALTLLVLPLVDIASEASKASSVSDIFDDHSYEIVSFLVSFVVIWVLWRNHHRVMEHFRGYDGHLMNLHLVWLLTIVILPFATGLVDRPDLRWANVFYVAVLAVSVGSLVAIERWGVGHPELIDEDKQNEEWLRHGPDFGTMALLAVALIICIAVPRAGVWPLFLLFLSGPVDKLIARFRHRGDAPS